MRTYTMLAMIVVAAAAPAFADEMPARFYGVWLQGDPATQSCRVGDWDRRATQNLQGMIRVESKQVIGWESECTVQRVRTLADGAMVRFHCFDEGMEHRPNEYWNVLYTKSGDVLTTGPSATAKQTTYVKCK